MGQVHRPELASKANRDASDPSELQIGSNLSSLIQRVSAASIVEIEMLITELQSLRNYLQNEGERLQRDITAYARLNQGAMESTKVITETLLRWKAAPDRSSHMQ